MKFSTKTEYGLRAILNLSKSPNSTKSVRKIAQEEKIPRKYLERILVILAKENIITSHKGKSGGYRLAKKLEKISMSEIISVLEGPINFMQCDKKNCQSQNCQLKHMWRKMEKEVIKSFEKINLGEIIRK